MDGVIRSWPPLDGIEAECGMPMGSIASTAFADDLLIPAITGAYDDSRWRRLITDRLSEEYPRQAVARAVELWSGTSGEVDTRVVEWLDEARSRDARVFLATNATSRLDDDLRVLGLLDRFDGVVNSSEIGAAKPDARFYRAAVTIAGTTPSGCLFIDDQPRNVDAATRLGMAGVHYQGFESLPNLP